MVREEGPIPHTPEGQDHLCEAQRGRQLQQWGPRPAHTRRRSTAAAIVGRCTAVVAACQPSIPSKMIYMGRR